MKTDPKIQELREQLDAADAALVGLLVRRMELCTAIGEIKKAEGLPVLDSAREAEVLRRVSALAGEDYAGDVQSCYETLLRLSRQRQQRLREKTE